MSAAVQVEVDERAQQDAAAYLDHADD
jgi:hypothetical protein